MTKYELQREVKELEFKKEVIGKVIADMRSQYNSLAETIFSIKAKIERLEQEERRKKQSEHERTMRARITNAATARKVGDGYRLGTGGDEEVRDPIPQKTMNLMHD